MSKLPKSENHSIHEESIEVNQDGSELWSRLHDEAQDRYEEISSSRRMGWWGAVLVIASLVLLASIWGAYRKFSQLGLESRPPAQTAAAYALATSLENTALAGLVSHAATQTAPGVTPAPAGSEDALNQPTQAQVNASVTPSPVPATATVTAVTSCQDIASYHFELVSGPELFPDQGYYYFIGYQEPTVQASWVIKNIGNCDWVQMAIFSNTDRRLLTPILRWEGHIVTPAASGGGSILVPGEQIEIVVGYKAMDARNVSEDWVLVVNGFALSDQPHLVVDVENWILGIRVTSTPRTGKPPKPAAGTPNSNPSPTHPSERPKETPPSTRP